MSSFSHSKINTKLSNLEVSKLWFLLAIFSLTLADFLALILVVSRAPVINSLIYSPEWAKKCLVIHVNLALGVWFFSFFLSIWSWLYPPPRWTYYVSVCGVFLLGILSFFLTAKPILSNYIPVLDEPIFLIGLFLFYLGVAFAIVLDIFLVKRKL